jgi:hypothetical protein
LTFDGTCWSMFGPPQLLGAFGLLSSGWSWNPPSRSSALTSRDWISDLLRSPIDPDELDDDDDDELELRLDEEDDVDDEEDDDDEDELSEPATTFFLSSPPSNKNAAMATAATARTPTTIHLALLDAGAPGGGPTGAPGGGPIGGGPISGPGGVLIAVVGSGGELIAVVGSGAAPAACASGC